MLLKNWKKLSCFSSLYRGKKRRPVSLQTFNCWRSCFLKMKLRYKILCQFLWKIRRCLETLQKFCKTYLYLDGTAVDLGIHSPSFSDINISKVWIKPKRDTLIIGPKTHYRWSFKQPWQILELLGRSSPWSCEVSYENFNSTCNIVSFWRIFNICNH